MLPQTKLEEQILRMRAAVIEATCAKLRFRPMTKRIVELLRDGRSNEEVFDMIEAEQPRIVKLRLKLRTMVRHAPLVIFLVLILAGIIGLS